MAEDELLEGLKRENSTYDAFARDIAVLNIYFGEPEFQGKSLKKQKENRKKKTYCRV